MSNEYENNKEEKDEKKGNKIFKIKLICIYMYIYFIFSISI